MPIDTICNNLFTVYKPSLNRLHYNLSPSFRMEPGVCQTTMTNVSINFGFMVLLVYDHKQSWQTPIMPPCIGSRVDSSVLYDLSCIQQLFPAVAIVFLGAGIGSTFCCVPALARTLVPYRYLPPAQFEFFGLDHQSPSTEPCRAYGVEQPAD